MKKNFFLFFLVALVGVGFMTIGVVKADAAPIKLTFSIFFPPTHGQAVAAYPQLRGVTAERLGMVTVVGLCMVGTQ